VPPYYRDDNAIKKFGEKLREIRQARNMSQEQLAHACGLEYSQINRIELGKVNTSVSHVVLLARHLGVTPCDLLSFE